MEYWSIGVLECWSVGVLECWSVGVLECWGNGTMGRGWRISARVVSGRVRIPTLCSNGVEDADEPQHPLAASERIP
jgi:hypothetical protein